MKTMMRLLSVLFTAALLASCGGGGGCAGTPTNGTNTCNAGPAPGAAPVVARFIYTLDKFSITNSGSDTALLTIKAVDGNNQAVADVPLTISLNTGSYTASSNATDAKGEVKATIDIGGDYANRIITATFTDGNATGVASIAVTGAAVSIQALPAAPAPGDVVTVTVKATNINGQGINAVNVQVTGLGLAAPGTTVVTGVGGSATTTITAPAAGSYTLNAAGLGVTQSLPITVVGGGGGGTIPNAVGPISGANLSINPNTIGPNTPGSTTSRAALKVLFKDAGNLPIQYVRARYEIVAPSGSVGESISTGANIVYSDASGVATADYIAGTTTSPTNGVNIRVCYGLTDTDLAGGACPSSVTATMTVAGQALSISIGSNNTLERGTGQLTYKKSLVVTVNDAAGVAVAGAGVSASVDITHYAKGYAFNDPYYIKNPSDGLYYRVAVPNITVLNDATAVPLAPTPGATPSDPPQGDGARFWCVNEDYNRNGLMDTTLAAGADPLVYPGGIEDVNGSGSLEPRKADVTISYVNGQTTTGPDGTLLLTIQYPQNVATWLAYTVKVSTSVGGTEGKDEKSFVTDYIIGDETNGSFLLPLHGYGNCTVGY